MEKSQECISQGKKEIDNLQIDIFFGQIDKLQIDKLQIDKQQIDKLQIDNFLFRYLEKQIAN